MVNNRIIPTEEQDQAALVLWLERKGLRFTAIPNSTWTPSWQQKRKNYRMGVRPGFPDLVVVVHDRLIAIELKRSQGGRVSPVQHEWIAALNDVGVETRVCKGFEEAKAFIEEAQKLAVFMGRDTYEF
jgi:hypothetical protein